MKQTLFILLITAHLAFGLETDTRTWTSTVGSTLEAQLVHADEKTVTLQREDGTRLPLQISQLCSEDRDFIKAYLTPKGATQIEGLNATPGEISAQITCLKDSKWSYHLYLPTDFHDGRQWPVWFIMSPTGGRNTEHLRRYMYGAERLGCIVVLSVESKNSFADSELAIAAMADDVFDRLPVASGLAFSSGMSGGSRMAYLMAERDRRIAGVLACGSGSGVYLNGDQFRDAKLRSSTYVYSLIGTNCFNRTGAFKSHSEFPKHFRLRFFPGKHQWANPNYIEQGMARVLGSALDNFKAPSAEAMRHAYAETMWEWTANKQDSEPWEAYYWADYLKDFPGTSEVQADASRLARQLESDPTVRLAINAEREILKFARKHFDVFYTQDQNSNDARKKDADRLAEKFSTIPHGALIRRLGDPS